MNDVHWSRKLRTKHFKWLWLSGVVIIFDQLSKYWAEHILRGDTIVLFSWFDFSLVHNKGAAFGFLDQAGGWQHVFFCGLALIVSITMLFWIKALKDHERHLAIAYSLIIAGALGNAIDRVVYQYVVDFVHWFYQDWHYPHFNVADIAISLAAGLLIADAFGKPFLNKTSKLTQD
jgi:signal peptidase II